MAFTSTGTKLSVSVNAPATFDAAGYAALAWTPVACVTSIPAFGAQAAVVPLQCLEDGHDKKYGGFVNYGSLTVEGAADPADAGQTILANNALQPNAEISIKIEYSTGAVRYCYGKCFSATENVGGANNIVGASFNIEFNKPVVKVVA